MTRFTQPTLDESDLAQLERSRAERYRYHIEFLMQFVIEYLKCNNRLIINGIDFTFDIYRSQFVQSLLLSTLSIADETDEQNNTLDDTVSHPEQICEDTANTVSLDSVTSNAPTARASDYEEAKKKQESASHSDLDSHPPHLSGKNRRMTL